MRWTGWTTLIAGTWLVVAPFVLGYATSTETAEDVILGILIVAFSIGASAVFANWLVALFGAWVLLAPFVLGYAARPVSTTNDVIVGIVVLVVGLIGAAVHSRTRPAAILR